MWDVRDVTVYFQSFVQDLGNGLPEWVSCKVDMIWLVNS